MEQRELRDILLLPALEREREQRKTPDRKKFGLYSAALFVFILLTVGGFFTYAYVNRVEVPDVVGMSESQARIQFESAGIRYEVGSRKYSVQKIGTVLEQSPAAGKWLSPFASVRLILSAGTDEVRIPELIGENEVYAYARLSDLGLNPLVMEVSSSRPPGTVVRLEPGAGSIAVTGDTVTLMISALREQLPLREYNLSNKTVVLVTLSTPGLEKDAPADVGIRLSALLQAANARVVTVSSLADLSRIRERVDCVLVLSVRADATANGLELKSFRTNGEPLLAQNIESGLSKSAKEIRSVEWTELLFPAISAAYQAELSLGNVGSAEDKANFSEDGFLEVLARGAYLGIGETLTNKN